MHAAATPATMPANTIGVSLTGCKPTSTSTPANAHAMPIHLAVPSRSLNHSHAISALHTGVVELAIAL